MSTHSAASHPSRAYPTADPLLQLDAITLSKRIRAGKVTSERLMETTLARIAEVNPSANAIIEMPEADKLLAQARAADKALARGRHAGWLHGIPQAPKDLAMVKGFAFSRGSPLYADTVSEIDSLHIARARQAGAIMIGKTNVPEFGLGSQTYNTVYGATSNAYAPTLCAGGSSGGTAVALALNMLPVADGSDMMGSLRNPAAFNGIYGMRPSHGRVPSWPMPDQFTQQLAVCGPMARTARDCAAMMATQAGFDPRAPLSLDGDGSEFMKLALSRHTRGKKQPLAGVRIGWLADMDGYLAMQDGILTQSKRALRALERLGAIVQPISLGFPPEKLWSTWLTLRQGLVGGNLYAHYIDRAQRKMLKPEAQWEAKNGLRASAADFAQASVARTEWYDAACELYTRHDLLALPTVQVFPFDIDTHWPREIAGRKMDTYHRWMEVVLPATMGGLPAISMPTPTSARERAQGRLSGLQLIGAPRQDLFVLRAAIAYDDAQQA